MLPFLREPPLGRGPFFSVWHRSEPRIPFAWHYHDAFELTLIVSSRGRRLVGDGEERFDGGDLVLIGPGVPHTYASADDAPGPHEQVVMHFDRRLFGNEALKDAQLASLEDLLDTAGKGLRFGASTRKRVQKLILRLPDERPLIRLGTFFQILDILSQSPGSERHVLSGISYGAKATTSDPAPIKKISAFLEDNFRKPISPAQAARKMGMSTSAFGRFFKQATGRSFVSYVNELRLRHASRLLLSTDDNISQVAAASGFPNVSYFNRRFLAAKKVQPGEYRQSIRKLRATLPPT